MMDEKMIHAWRPSFERAVKEMYNDPSKSVFRHKDMQLLESADQSDWQPDQDILSYLPNFDEIEINMISEETDITKVFTILRFSKNVGLVLMGRDINRHDKPSLIVLTTESIYYVIDPRDEERGLPLFKMALSCPDLTLWTSNCMFEAECLYHKYGINLLESNSNSCMGQHLHLMKIISSQAQKVLYSSNAACSFYPERALYLARQRDPKLPSFKELLRTWLGLENLGHFDFFPTQSAHLDTRPLNLTAINMIKRRCCLVLKLSEALQFFVRSEPEIMNRNVLECLLHCSENISKLVRMAMRRDEDNKRVNMIYFVHLDLGSHVLEEPKD